MCYLPFKALGESLWLNFEHSGIKEAKKRKVQIHFHM